MKYSKRADYEYTIISLRIFKEEENIQKHQKQTKVLEIPEGSEINS